MEKVLDKFLRYVKVNTESDPKSGQHPSSRCQFDLAKMLEKELKDLGLINIRLSENGYVYGTLPKNTDEDVKTIGFISHMDTAPDMSGENVNPQIIENYDGSDIILNKELGIVLSPSKSPELLNYKGKTLVTTDGTTLLGADDKAGISEIMTAIEYLVNHPEIKHGDIKVGFTPDEEIGEGADFFDVDYFDADYAYTIDGGRIGELEYENFNAAGVKIEVFGTNVHPGYAKDKMKNSMTIATEIMNILPKNEVPEQTSGYEGFYHLTSIVGDVEKTELSYIIRDFSTEGYNNRIAVMENIEKNMNNKYGEGTVKVYIKEQYRNMREKIEDKMYIVDRAKKAMEDSGVVPEIRPIRGGTDGARLSFMGLPTPNIFTGGENFHGRYEYIPVESMEKAVEVIVNIAKL